jgi:uncharacterized OsmC-like protein
MSDVRLGELQKPLRARYRTEPSAALVTDHAATIGAEVDDPLHSAVEPMPGCGVTVPIGVHRGLGGLHDQPTPGDMLCAALAACQDSAVRLVANLLGVELESLVVEVTGQVDLRGTMALDMQVPVGFQSMRCRVELRPKEGTDPQRLQRLYAAAERSCVVQQTLRSGVPIETVFQAVAPAMSSR